MSKASKNGTSSGEDERNMNFRRLKSTNNSSQASSIVTLAEKQTESESSTRLKNSGVATKNESVAVKNNQKSKLRTPAQIGLGQSVNRINKPSNINSNKEVKKNSGPIKIKNPITKMKPEADALEQKSLNSQSETKNSTEQVENKKQNNEVINTHEQSPHKQENGNELNGRKLEDDTNHSEAKENGKTEQNGAETLETNEKEEEFNLHLEPEDNSNKLKEEVSKDSLEAKNENLISNESKQLVQEKQENTQINPESCSVDIVESTTSETVETVQSNELLENKSNDKQSEDPNNDAVSYDSSITLKDVKIKLNDCLKDSKAEDENTDQNISEYAHKEATFGRTLRTISGRNSLGRMRHITLRDRQPSPNSSLFVNTSNISLSEDSVTDYKILHHRNTLLELSSSNGDTPRDRKRKLVHESLSAKKAKTETSSSPNSPFAFIKFPFNLQRPVEVPTLSKFLPEQNNTNTSEELKTEEPGIVQKWCVIM